MFNLLFKPVLVADRVAHCRVFMENKSPSALSCEGQLCIQRRTWPLVSQSISSGCHAFLCDIQWEDFSRKPVFEFRLLDASLRIRYVLKRGEVMDAFRHWEDVRGDYFTLPLPRPVPPAAAELPSFSLSAVRDVWPRSVAAASKTTLDLHIGRDVHPADCVKDGGILGAQLDICKDFMEDARSRGISVVHIIHGKGAGVLKAAIQTLLQDDYPEWGVEETPDGGAVRVYVRKEWSAR